MAISYAGAWYLGHAILLAETAFVVTNGLSWIMISGSAHLARLGSTDPTSVCKPDPSPGMGADPVPDTPPPTLPLDNGPLHFGPDDLVYGPAEGGALRRLANAAGGKLLTNFTKPPELTVTQFSLQNP